MDGPVESRARLLALVRGSDLASDLRRDRLGIPDLPTDGPREIDELAHATGSHPASLRRVLLFLAGVDILDKVGPRRFALTEVAAPLRTGARAPCGHPSCCGSATVASPSGPCRRPS
jgi:hypothetical protein